MTVRAATLTEGRGIRGGQASGGRAGRSGGGRRTMGNILLVQGSRYVVVGIGNVILDVTLLNTAVALTHVTGGPLLILFASLSFLAAVTNGYYWNGRWTFQAPLYWKVQLPLFLGVSLVGLLINGATIAFVMAHPIGPVGFSPILRINEAKLIAIGITATWNFLGSRCIVFRAASAR